MTATPALEADNLYLGYGDSEIVHGVSLRASSGSIAAIVGPNGSGKSTLLKGLAGLLRPLRGHLRFGGQDVTGRDTAELVRLGVGYVPQVKNVFPRLTVKENLEVGATTCRRKFKERAHEVTTLFPDLSAAMTKQAGQLSGGQRNMLALARALMAAPSLLLVDEPTAGLSPKAVDAVWLHLQQVVLSGVGIVIVEQNTVAALNMARDAYLLVNGELAFSGPADELSKAPDLARTYLGG